MSGIIRVVRDLVDTVIEGVRHRQISLPFRRVDVRMLAIVADLHVAKFIGAPSDIRRVKALARVGRGDRRVQLRAILSSLRRGRRLARIGEANVLRLPIDRAHKPNMVGAPVGQHGKGRRKLGRSWLHQEMGNVACVRHAVGEFPTQRVR